MLKLFDILKLLQRIFKLTFLSAIQLSPLQNQSFFPQLSYPQKSSSPSQCSIMLGSCCDAASLNHSPFSPHLFLTDAPGYLVVVAPGTVWLADCGRQLFGGEPVTAVTKVGHPCADRVISGEHTSVHWRDGHTT